MTPNTHFTVQMNSAGQQWAAKAGPGEASTVQGVPQTKTVGLHTMMEEPPEFRGTS